MSEEKMISLECIAPAGAYIRGYGEFELGEIGEFPEGKGLLMLEQSPDVWKRASKKVTDKPVGAPKEPRKEE